MNQGSAQALIDMVINRVKKIFPISESKYKVELLKVNAVNAEKYASDYDKQQEAKLNNINYTIPIKGVIKITDTEKNKVIEEKEITIVDIPASTVRSTFIINGKEYSIRNQLRRKAGVYSNNTEDGEVEGEVLVKGASYKIKLDSKTSLFTIILKGKTRPLYSFLKAMNLDDATISSNWGKEIFEINAAKFKQKHIEDIKEILKTDNVKDKMSTYKIDKGVMKFNLGKNDKDSSKLEPLDFLKVSKKLLDIYNEKDESEPRDAMAFKNFMSATKIFSEYIDNTTAIIKKGVIDNIKKGNINLDEIVNTGYANSKVNQFFSNTLVNVVDKSNPLAILAAPTKVSLLGQGAITDENKAPISARNISASQIGFLDPSHTPPAKTGLSLALAEGSTFKPMGGLKTKVLNREGKIIEMSPETMYDKYIAFPDQFDDKFNPNHTMVRVAYRGKIKEVSPKEVDLKIPNAQNMFSLSSNLIPFLESDSGGRAQMAAQMHEQAISLKHREAPLIDTEINGKFGTKEAGERILTKSPVSGEVIKTSNKSIIIKTNQGKTKKINIYNNFHIGGDEYIDETPIVKVGDKVNIGDVLTDNNYTKDGKLALGKNLTVAYLPGRGYTFEDGFVLTEQGAQKMTSLHTKQFEIEKKDDTIFNKNSAMAKLKEPLTKEKSDTISPNGIVKEGTILEKGHPISLRLKKRDLKRFGNINKQFKDIYVPENDVWEKDVKGKVISVKESGPKFVVSVKYESPAKIGDKVAGRHGNKGVITHIIPNSQAPKRANGDYIDMILSPAGIPSRMNEGQMMEVALSKVAKKNKKPISVKSFSLKNNSKDIMSVLKKSKISDKEDLYDPELGTLKNVGVGEQYILKLEQRIDKKNGSRGLGAYDLNEQPVGGKGGGQSMNRLLLHSLLAHNARENMSEMTSLKSQKNDEYWRAYKMGLPTPPPKQTPFALKKFYDLLQGMGIDNKREGSNIKLLPLTNKKIDKMSNGEITNGKFIKGTDGSEIKGGLFDKKITGGVEGNNWSHISLAREIPNPTFEKAIMSILKITKNQFEGIMSNKLSYNEKKDEWFESKGSKKDITGVEGMKKVLSNYNLDKEIKKDRKKANSVTDKTKLNALNRRIRYMTSLEKNDISTNDYFLNKIPVVPPKIRPLYESEGTIIQNPLNRLYSNVAVYNNKWKDIKYDSKKLRASTYKNLYNQVKSLYGLAGGNIVQGREFEGIAEQIKGKQPKKGFFQKKVIKKRQDVSARTVITLNTKLNPDEVGMPKKIAWKLYDPFIMKKLTSMGNTPLESIKLIKDKAPVADEALKQIIKERPVLINRDPALHKYSILAVKPVLTKGIKSLQLNPFITKGFGADFDGDQMSIHIPISEKAVKEAKGMFPTHNLINPKDNKLTLIPREDALLGLSLLTESGGKDLKIKFSNLKSAMEFFLDKKRAPNEIFTLKGKKTTFGREYIKSITKGVSAPKEKLTKKNMDSFMKSIYKEHPKQYGEILFALNNAGNDFAYSTGFSVGLSDFVDTPEKERKALYKDTLKKIRDINKKYKKPSAKKERALSKVLGEASNKTVKILDSHYKGKNNNVYKMVDVGSKGNKSQLAQIMVAPIAMTDVEEKNIPLPIGRSYATGLPISDYFLSLFGQRKGAVGSRLSVSVPGLMGKQLVNTAMENVISEKDCKTIKGRIMSINSSGIIDRYLAKGIGGFLHNTLLTDKVINKLKKKKIKKVEVRSPLGCKADHGICQMCFGLDENGKLPNIGTNVGAIAATTMAEPLTQMALGSKHTGGVSDDNKYVGLPRIDQLTSMSERVKESAVLSEVSGKVERIYDGPAGGKYIIVNGFSHFLQNKNPLKVKIGSEVKKGEPLSEGPINPNDVLRISKSIDQTREFITSELDRAYSGAGVGIRPIIYETMTKSLTDLAFVNKSKDESSIPGSYIPLNRAEKLKAKNKIEFTPILKGVGAIPNLKPDWMGRISFNHITGNLIDAASSGSTTDIHGYNPMPAWAHGEDFGKGTLGRY